MPEIQLPTATKQDEILINTQKISQKLGLSYPSNALVASARATGVDYSNYTTMLEINGAGLLHEVYIEASDLIDLQKAYPNGLRITIDGGSPITITSSYGGSILANRKLNLIYMYSKNVGGTFYPTYSVRTTRNRNDVFRGFYLLEDSLEFKTSLKIEHFSAEKGTTYVTYTLKEWLYGNFTSISKRRFYYYRVE